MIDSLATAKRLFAAAGLFAAAAILLLASQARAADSVYWADYEAGQISFAGLAGGGAGALDVSGADASEANGMVIDAAAGKAYWVTGAGKIYFANLSGGGGGQLNTAGASEGFQLGAAIDPIGGRLYWVAEGKITYANLNGSGGGDLDTSGATVDGPTGVAVDRAAGRVYWSNSGPGAPKVSYASIGGGGGGDLPNTGTTGEANGLALDLAAGKVYWADYSGDRISYANLNGIGFGDVNTAGATVDAPWGVAVDPIAGRVYWANEQGAKISYANLNGSGGADLDTGSLPIVLPAFPVLLKAPAAATAPLATGSSKPGSTLTCTPGTWAPDLLESFLYRAPQTTSLQWLKDGQPIAGATTSTYAAGEVGTYSCQSSAANHAGSTAQTSASVAVFSLAKKAKLNRKKGTATLSVRIPSAGTLTLTGKQVVKQKRTGKAAGTIKLLVKAKGKAKKALNRKGKAKMKLTVAFAPTSGSATSQVKKLVLKKNPAPGA
jgi:uncharacterized protein YjbI with pentapeptide repeats